MQCRSRCPVAGVHIGRDSMRPEGGREFGLNQESSGTSSKFLVGMLCNSILVRFSVLTAYSLISTELIVFFADKFTSFVIPGHLNALLDLVLSIGLVLLEGHQCI